MTATTEQGTSDRHRAAWSEYKAFVDEHIAPVANELDRRQEIPRSLIQLMAKQGFLGATISQDYGGKAVDAMTWGLLCQEFGRGSASLLSLLTVHSMVATTLQRWGSAEQRARWLPKMVTGECVVAFGLTEPEAGSDAKGIRTQAVSQKNGIFLSGKKKWISFGQMADAFLIFAQADGKPTAFLIERDLPGLKIEPICNMSGFRSAMLAEVHLERCMVSEANIIGKPGFGLSHIAGSALDHGRYSIAWGALGILQGCLDACLDYAISRTQFDKKLCEHQLLQAMVSDMICQTTAARLMCENVANLKDDTDPTAIIEATTAKYFCTRAAVQVASDAVQLHGANGLSDDYPVSRYLRDAKVLELIEGSNQMQQVMISNHQFQKRVGTKQLEELAQIDAQS